MAKHRHPFGKKWNFLSSETVKHQSIMCSQLSALRNTCDVVRHRLVTWEFLLCGYNPLTSPHLQVTASQRQPGQPPPRDLCSERWQMGASHYAYQPPQREWGHLVATLCSDHGQLTRRPLFLQPCTLHHIKGLGWPRSPPCFLSPNSTYLHHKLCLDLKSQKVGGLAALF